MSERRRVRGVSPYEEMYGFCRAIRLGDRVVVSGTAPIWDDGSCDPDPGVQAARCIEIIEEALTELGASLADVIRTRNYIVDPADSEAVGLAHGTAFGEARPVNTMVVVAALVDPRWKVEIEVEAVVATE